jgi:plastocyanin
VSPGRARALGLAAAAVALGGCGSSYDSQQSPPRDVVTVADFSFAPGELHVKAGDTVTWTNRGAQIHNVSGRGFFSRAMDPGTRYAFRFTRPGRYPYLCTLHPTRMKGVIVAG